MLDLRFIRENAEIVKKAVKDRNMDVDIAKLLDFDSKRRKILKESEVLKHKKKVMSQEIGQKIAKKDDVSQEKSEITIISQKIKEFDTKVEDINKN